MLRLYALILPTLLGPCFAQQLSSVIVTADPVLLLKSPSSVTLTANAVRTVGANREIGTLVLKAQSDGSSSEEWNLASGKTTSTAGSASMGRACAKTDVAGVTSDVVDLECLRPFPWFAPWVGNSLITSGLVTVGLLTTEVNSTADHVFSLPSSPTGRLRVIGRDVQAASSVTLSYDPVTHLPTKSVYRVPAGPYGNTVEIDVLYSDYREEGGFMLPHHLVRSVQHTQDLDVHVTTVTVN